MLGEAFGEVKWSRASGEIAQQYGEFSAKFRVILRLLIDLFQFAQRHHESFGHELAAVRPEMAFDIFGDVGLRELRGNGIGDFGLR